MNKTKIKGTFVKLLKGGVAQNWALLMFKPTENSKNSLVIYSRNNIPNLFVPYEIEISDNGKYSNKILHTYVPIIVKKEINWEEYLVKHIPNIGKNTAKKINDNFGCEIFKYVNEYEKNSEKLLQVITEKQIKTLQKYYNENKDIINSLIITDQNNENDIHFFYSNNLQKFYEKLQTTYKSKKSFIELFKEENPYKLYFDYDFNLQEVDKFALLLEWDVNCLERFRAFVDFVIKEEENNNSTLILLKEVAKKVFNYFNVTKEELIEMFNFLVTHEKIKMSQINSNYYLTRKKTYEKEKEIIKLLKKINKKNSTLKLKIENSDFVKKLSFEQKDAFTNFLNNNISIISGGPGTGKSFLINYFNQLLKLNKYENEKDYFIVAPTGRASTNISIKINDSCRTIHSMLKIDKDDNFVRTDEQELNKIKIIIIDEFSMVNLNIFYNLLVSCKNLEKLILIGDVDQLPAIGPGNILEELIKSNLIKTTYLNKNFRSEFKEIIEHMNSVKNNIKPTFKSNIVDLYEINKNLFLEKIIKIYLSEVDKFSLDKTIILTPSYKGEYGLYNINNKIQEKLNYNGKEIFSIKKNNVNISFKINDRVIQLENRIIDDIYNGDIGYIIDCLIDKKTKKKIIKVEFKREKFRKIIEYTESEFRDQINLAYGITVHKFQGSEIESVIFVINPDFEFMLRKKLIYTAISRAIKHLIIVTTNEVNYLDVLIKNNFQKEKILTNFKLLLEGEKWN
ncbi:ATP-dependent DNA helicase [Mycoplasmopsis cricetuli]|uniref:ATP-dependent DNA helicase n=1 Tax=Mycoplasmopsis cricetuli TaxID=171283 RepID=UPI0004729921|nr:AAA family ATPase [Mycoplasmopsis cricetuli]